MGGADVAPGLMVHVSRLEVRAKRETGRRGLNVWGVSGPDRPW